MKHVLSEPAWDELVYIALQCTTIFQISIQRKVHFPYVWKRCIYPLVQLLKLKCTYVGKSKSLHALDALLDIYQLAIPNIKLSREKQMIYF